MSNTKIAVLARGFVKPGYKDQVIELLHQRVELNDAEPGTLVHAVHFEQENPNVFWEYFIFEDREALSFHRECHSKLEGFIEKITESFATWPYVVVSDVVLTKGLSVDQSN